MAYTTSTLNDIRKANLQRIAKDIGGPVNLAAKLGYANASFLVQMIGPHPTRPVSEKTARMVEATLALPPESLDHPSHFAGPTRTAATPGAGVALHTDVLARVMDETATALRELNTTLPTNKFYDVVAFAYRECEAGREPDREFLKRLIALST